MNRFEKAFRVLLGQELPLPKNKWMFVVSQRKDLGVVQTKKVKKQKGKKK